MQEKKRKALEERFTKELPIWVTDGGVGQFADRLGVGYCIAFAGRPPVNIVMAQP
jgi:hypothetical protein